MTMTRTSRSFRRLPVAAAVTATVAALLLAGCAATPASTGSSGVTDADPAAAVASSASTEIENCEDGRPAVASLASGSITTDPDSWPADSTMAKIRKSGKLVVGTSGDVLLWGARNPQTSQLEGYDIDLSKQIAAAIGDNVKVEYKVINYAQRLPSLIDGDVQLVAHTMTINCDRWFGSDDDPDTYINFSTEYYRAGQKVLVRSDSDATGIDDLADARVCVGAGSTNLDNIQDTVADPVVVDDLGECLVKFQEGEVDAITGDDTVLAGFAAQDPYAEVVGDAFSVEPYGLGIAPDDQVFTRFVNAVLEDLRADGTLDDLYEKYMAEQVDGSAPGVPAAVYGRDVDSLQERG